MSWDAWHDRDQIIALLKDVLARLHLQEQQIVNVAEALSTLDTHTAAATHQVRQHLYTLHKQIDDLDTKVTDLQASLANAQLSPDQQAKVDALVAAVDVIDVPDVSPTPTPNQPPVNPVPTPDQPSVNPTPNNPPAQGPTSAPQVDPANAPVPIGQAPPTDLHPA